jgi:hypothetical protein
VSLLSHKPFFSFKALTDSKPLPVLLCFVMGAAARGRSAEERTMSKPKLQVILGAVDKLANDKLSGRK